MKLFESLHELREETLNESDREWEYIYDCKICAWAGIERQLLKNAMCPTCGSMEFDVKLTKIPNIGEGEEKWGVIQTGGSIGDRSSKTPKEAEASKEEAQAKAKRMNKQLSPGEKKYYGIKYKAVQIKEEEGKLNEYIDLGSISIYAKDKLMGTSRQTGVKRNIPPGRYQMAQGGGNSIILMHDNGTEYSVSSKDIDMLESKLNEGNFYECRDCGYAWAPDTLIDDPNKGQLIGTEENPSVRGSVCPKCGSSRIRVEY